MGGQECSSVLYPPGTVFGAPHFKAQQAVRKHESCSARVQQGMRDLWARSKRCFEIVDWRSRKRNEKNGSARGCSETIKNLFLGISIGVWCFCVCFAWWNLQQTGLLICVGGRGIPPETVVSRGAFGSASNV